MVTKLKDLNKSECKEIIRIIMNSKEYTSKKDLIMQKLHNQIKELNKK